jgi:hypothetical protein
MILTLFLQICGDIVCGRPSAHVPCHSGSRASQVESSSCDRYQSRYRLCCTKVLVRDGQFLQCPYSYRIHSAQRNTYLTGFCLFLSLVLTRTFYIILELIHTQEEYAKLKNAVRSPSPITFADHSSYSQTAKRSRGAGSEDPSRQIEELKEKLAAAESRNNDFGSELCFINHLRLLTIIPVTLKKQAAQQAEEYNRLATEFNEATGQVSNKRID